jgi:hypothetical protein
MKVILLIAIAMAFNACSSVKGVSKAKERAESKEVLHEGAF